MGKEIWIRGKEEEKQYEDHVGEGHGSGRRRNSVKVMWGGDTD